MKVSTSDFDDLVQNVLLKLWRNIASYNPEKARFRTWLGVVVRNAVKTFTMSLDEKSTNEIAAELNLSIDSVYTLKSRVKAPFIKEIKAVIDELEG
jgi:RNA polymerase sigma-70 factor (ECF subfamily)